MIYTYSFIAIIGVCLIIFLLLIFQRRREEEKKRREIALLTAKSQLDTLREKNNKTRKNLYEVENFLNDDRFIYKSKREELIQLAKQLKLIEEERDNVKKSMDEAAVDEKERSLMEKRLKLLQDKIDEMAASAKELQEEVNRREESTKENDQKFKLLTSQIAQIEKDIEQQKEIVKIKEASVQR
jgi:hypothetical protein